MNKEKAVNLAWVIILVPIVLSIFKMIRYGGFQESEWWPAFMVLTAVGMIIMLFIPVATGYFYDKFSKRQNHTH